ncbi:hypothetical protein Tco_0557073 [Tanacetum coccineum]
MCNRSDAHLAELDRLRTDLQRAMQANDGLSKKITLLDTAYFRCLDRERELLDRFKDMEKDRDGWRKTASDQAEVDHHKLVQEFIPTVVRKLDEVFLALRWHLKEIHVTWSHLEKK